MAMLIPTVSRAAGGEICDGIGGTFFGDIIVPAGATCDLGFGGDIIFGDVSIEPGATLTKTSGPLTILGDVDSNKLSGRLTCRNNVQDPGSKGSDGTVALRGQEGQCADLP
jgi:hypothetical protein